MNKDVKPNREAEKPACWVVVQPVATVFTDENEARAEAERQARSNGRAWGIARMVAQVEWSPQWEDQ